MNWNDYFIYDPVGGELIRKSMPLDHFASMRTFRGWHSRYAGRVAGHKTKTGYVTVHFRSKAEKAHRIIWEMHNGPIPDGMFVDHINGHPCDNRITNLRICNSHGNTSNARIRKDNTSGVRGVSFFARRRKWVAQINKDGKQFVVGAFDDKDDAISARESAEIELYGPFSPIVIAEMLKHGVNA